MIFVKSLTFRGSMSLPRSLSLDTYRQFVLTSIKIVLLYLRKRNHI